MVIEERRKQVAANLLGGLNYREMGEALDVSIGTIANDVKIIMGRWQREQVEAFSEWVAIENRRLDRLLNAVWSSAIEGKDCSIDRALRISESRRKLLGLDAPATTRTANIDLAKLSTEQLERLAKGEDIYAILADTGTSGT